MRTHLSLIILGILLIAITRCQTNFLEDEPIQKGTPDSNEPLLPTLQPVSPTQGDIMATPTPGIPVPENLIDLAKNKLAQRLSIPVGEIRLVEARPVMWPDSSLGCPQAGMEYAQVLTPGYLILLEHAGAIFEYHASRGNYVVTCENPSPPVPGSPGDT